MNHRQTEREAEMWCWCGRASAVTGQVEVFVATLVMVQVLRKGSILDAFMSNCTEACARVRLQWQRVAVESNEWGAGEQKLLALKKP